MRISLMFFAHREVGPPRVFGGRQSNAQRVHVHVTHDLLSRFFHALVTEVALKVGDDLKCRLTDSAMHSA